MSFQITTVLDYKINYKETTKRKEKKNMWSLNSILLNNQWVIEEIKDKIKKNILG